MEFNRESVLAALEAGWNLADVAGVAHRVIICAAGTDCVAGKHPDGKITRLEYADIIDLRQGVAV